ncbi:hypothetical protein HF086_005876 [Spodoptera exigua]|uniref:PiggyBac transposable element-derived protein domain-containing protein n=1 Tax=Spodoptera exigua TaxID=7107 RepID=A0A922MGJ4_SPOEX|nr:hypothetical protein HF086_005876 [Spodoptera exigua]
MDHEELLRILEGVDDGIEIESASDSEIEDESEAVLTENLPASNPPNVQDESDVVENIPGPPPIQWTRQPFGIETPFFDDFGSGISPSLNLTSSSNELAVFEKFVDEELIKTIIRYTNRYHCYFILNTDLRNHSRLQTWKDVTVPEMYIFLAITMLMTRNSRLTIEEHWSTNPLLNSPIYTTLMSRNRYTTILGMLHFSEPRPRHANDLILSKIITVVDDARQKFQSNFIPYKKLCIDESIVPFKGRLIIKQYIPNKRNRFGIKLFVLCDVETRIILDFIIYTGLETEIIRDADLGVSGSIVITFLQKYYFSNRQIYMDNWYSSPKLFISLLNRNIGACGTVKRNRKEMPEFKKLKKGERDVKYAPNIMALKWHDKKDVYMITTMHKDQMGPTEKIDRSTGLPKMKPECVIDYNEHMGIIDLNDMMLSSLHSIRKVTKWYKKLFFHIIDLYLLNGYNYYKVLQDNKTLRFAKYQLAVVTQIIQKYAGDKTLPMTSRNMDQPLRLIGNAARHMPAYLPDSKNYVVNYVVI